ncbi:hypothetical protein [Psychrobacillus vulpis]|uniref:Uncharacterized protein n=1 Tax=Psychrobacillus vulpis TaxID=2325572 RepID=A0A544TB55_9BACI|nr:hypothetical protein [Psychrobacillus vulpis]TQR14692.1 hypothetical protein FG384_19595 [Psychrobacillus vulpis]
MNTAYKCSVVINFTNGDVRIEVLGDGQKFSFISGLGFIALPELFLALSNLYKREANRSKVDYYGNYDYYYFSSDGTSLQVEHIAPYTDEIFYYIFNLKQYVIAVDKGFSEYLQLHRREGSLPLNQEDRLNPLGGNVIKYYNEFSLLINGH